MNQKNSHSDPAVDVSENAHASTRPRTNTLRWVGSVLWLLIPIVVWFAWQSRAAQSQEEQPEAEGGAPVSITSVPDFELDAHTGDKVTQEFLKGQPTVVGFVFTRCVTTCPMITKAMKSLSDEVGDADVRFLTITVDPKHDTTEVLANYAEIFDANPEQWLFATGTSADIYRLINLGFGMYAEEVFGADRKPGYEVAHTNRVILLNEEAVPVRSFLAVNDGDMAVLRRILTGKRKFPTPPVRKKVTTTADSADDETASKEADETNAGTTDNAELNPEQTSAAEEELGPMPAWMVRLPDINAGLNSLATVLLIAGLVAVKSGRHALHKKLMLTAFVASIAFLGCYLVHHYGLYQWTGSGSKKFTGTGLIRPIYFTILITHVVLAMLVPVLAIITILRGLKGDLEKHRKIARVTFPIWLYVSITGVVIYGFLYHWPVES